MNPDLILILILTSLYQTECSFIQYVTVREGAGVVLSCGNASSSRSCEADWHFLNESMSAPLFLRGQRQTGAGRSRQGQTGADLLQNCSMSFKNVTREEAGHYSCSTSEHQQGAETDIVLSVIAESEQRSGPLVTRSCTLWTVRFYRLTLEWQLNGEEVPKNHPQLKTSYSNSSVSVSVFVSFNDTDASSEFYRSLECHIVGGNKKREEKPPAGTRSNKDVLIVVIVTTAALIAVVCVVVAVIWIRTKKS